jgi:LPS-assembly protein
MRSVPPFFVFLLASSTAASFAAESDLPTAQAASGGEGAGSNPVTPASNDVIIEGLTDQSEMVQAFDEGITYFRHGVVVRYRGMELVANQVAMSESTGDIIADGQVRLQNEGQYFIGEHLEYNYKTGQMRAENFRAGVAPFYSGGLTLEGNFETHNYSAGNTFFTTDDIKEPAFRVRAKQFRLIDGQRVEARNATIVMGDTSTIPVPYYKRELKKHDTYWRFTPGYRSYFGPYLLSGYYFPITTNILGGVKLDLYAKRGLGVGPDIAWDLPRWGKGDFQYYYINDNEPRTDPFDQPIRQDRHRISFSHQATLRTNLTAKVVVREQSDPYIIRDFFETEYRNNTQPRSFLEVNQLWSNWSLDILAQPQLNEFYETVERLPDVKLSGIRQQIGETPLYYESESSLAYLRFQPGAEEFDPFGEERMDYSAMRADSFHQILWPQNYFGWLNFTPRIGGRVTQYGETDGFGTTFDDRTRFIFNTGAEVSTKASRVWAGAENKFFDVDGLRHIIEPSVNYVFVPSPNYTPNELPQFDREIPSLRLLPIDFPDYNAIDSIDSQNVLRFGLRNKLQTKRDGEIQNLVHWALYTDWRLNPREGQSTFADVYSDLDLRPRSWLGLSSETRFSIEEGVLNGSYHAATISPNDTWSWRGGHRYFRGGPEFGPDSDNNTFFSSLYYKFNENWGARVTHHFEARDGTLEEQYYSLYRDFRNWTGALTFRLRDHRTRADDFTVAFTFQLKAFPRFRMGDDQNEHSFLLGS